MKVKLVAVVALAAVGVGSLLYAFGVVGGTSAAGDTQYLTSTATIGDVTEEVAATGALESAATYGLVFGDEPFLLTDDASAPDAETSWLVDDVAVAVGDTVAVGDVLATANSDDLEGQLDLAKSALSSARIGLRGAKADIEDADDADDAPRIRTAKIGVINAETQLATAETEVDELRAQIRAARLIAPIDGVVTEVNIEAGYEAPAGSAVVVAANAFEVTTDVVESDLADVAVGQTASIAIPAIDTEVEGTVTAISPVAVDGGTGVVSYPVTIAISDAPAGARAGMSADITIAIASAEGVLVVPSAALRGRDGAYSVMTLGPDGIPTPTAVEVGLVTNSSAEIVSGLDEGTAVVTGTTADLVGNDAVTGGFPGGGAAFPVGGRLEGRPGGGEGPNVVIEEAP